MERLFAQKSRAVTPRLSGLGGRSQKPGEGLSPLWSPPRGPLPAAPLFTEASWLPRVLSEVTSHEAMLETLICGQAVFRV